MRCGYGGLALLRQCHSASHLAWRFLFPASKTAGSRYRSRPSPPPTHTHTQNHPSSSCRVVFIMAAAHGGGGDASCFGSINTLSRKAEQVTATELLTRAARQVEPLMVLRGWKVSAAGVCLNACVHANCKCRPYFILLAACDNCWTDGLAFCRGDLPVKPPIYITMHATAWVQD